jgi:cytosine/adenosine deaminase-related metal-dependent hydrolase
MPDARIAAYRGVVLHFLADPGEGDNPHAMQFFEDGLLVVEDGWIKAVGDAASLLPALPPNAQRAPPWRAFYLATLGGAQALGLDDRIGNFKSGNEADFVVLRLDSTPLMARRIRNCSTLGEKVFALMMLGDDREIAATYVLGETAYVNQPLSQRL